MYALVAIAGKLCREKPDAVCVSRLSQEDGRACWGCDANLRQAEHGGVGGARATVSTAASDGHGGGDNGTGRSGVGDVLECRGASRRKAGRRVRAARGGRERSARGDAKTCTGARASGRWSWRRRSTRWPGQVPGVGLWEAGKGVGSFGTGVRDRNLCFPVRDRDGMTLPTLVCLRPGACADGGREKASTAGDDIRTTMYGKYGHARHSGAPQPGRYRACRHTPVGHLA